MQTDGRCNHGYRVLTAFVQGTFRYQACDDRICYLSQTVPLQWTLRYEPLDYQRVPVELQRKGSANNSVISVPYPSNRYLRHRVAPVARRGAHISYAMNPGVNVDESLTAARGRATSVTAGIRWRDALGEARSGNRCAGLVIALGTGVVGGR